MLSFYEIPSISVAELEVDNDGMQPKLMVIDQM